MVANVSPLPAKHPDTGLPRRCYLDKLHLAEKAITDAMHEVEMLGADPLLTSAVSKLAEAKNHVADWLEGKVG